MRRAALTAFVTGVLVGGGGAAAQQDVASPRVDSARARVAGHARHLRDVRRSAPAPPRVRE